MQLRVIVLSSAAWKAELPTSFRLDLDRLELVYSGAPFIG